MSWRDRARPIIDRVLAETCGQSERDIRKALHDAYPFGQRRYHPYKIWCDEVRLQRGLKPHRAPCKRPCKATSEAQAEMFQEPAYCARR